MKRISFTKFAAIVGIEIVLLSLTGILAILLYGYPSILTRMSIFLLSFGSAAILMFNFIRYLGIKEFVILSTLLTITITIFLFKNFSILSGIHHASIVILLAVIIWFMYYMFPEEKHKYYTVIGFLYWVIAISLFFYILFISNGLFLKFRHGMDAVNFQRISLRALKFGPVVGLGIGIGHIISFIILKRK